jgi:hypothetical protein
VANVSPNDSLYAKCIGSPAQDFDLFGYFCGQLEQAADARFELEQYKAREAWLANAVAYLEMIYRLAEEFVPQEQLAELVAYLSWRSVSLHPTIQ